MGRISLSEGAESFEAIREAWFADAKKVSDTTQLADFVQRLIDDYDHDYGTIVWAHAAAAVAALHCMNRSRAGGITVFQASAIGITLYARWLDITTPFRVLRWENLLYPQYEATFRTIPKSAWAWAQKEAARMIQDRPGSRMAPHVRAHMTRIVRGDVPFGLRVEKENDHGLPRKG